MWKRETEFPIEPDQRKCNLFDKYTRERRVKPRSNNARDIRDITIVTIHHPNILMSTWPALKYSRLNGLTCNRRY